MLKRLSERKAERLDYIGTCFGLTADLLRFWKSQNFVPVYLRYEPLTKLYIYFYNLCNKNFYCSQKSNDLTGEHSTILICSLNKNNYNINDNDNWLAAYYKDFRRRMLKLLGKSFSKFTTGLALSLLEHRAITLNDGQLTQDVIDSFFLPHDIERLEAYCRSQVEYRLILDLTVDLALLYFDSKLINGNNIDALQKAILLGIGLQNKSVDQMSTEFNMPGNQVLAKFYDCIKKLTKSIVDIMESNIGKTIKNVWATELSPLPESLNEELQNAADKLKKKQKKELLKLKKEDFSHFSIKGKEEEWNKALTNNKSKIVSVKM